MKIQRIVCIVIFGLFVTSGLRSQDKKDEAPKTKLGAFESRTGSVLIKGFADVGSVAGNGYVEVGIREFTDAASGKKEYGIVLEVKGMGRSDRKTRALIDYDELDGLLKGIDYVRKIDRTATKLSDFEAIYRTRDGVKVTVFSSTGGKIEAAVETGHYAGDSAFLSLQQLDALRALILQAKTKIEGIKST
jgi:hypothetical protein